VSTDALLARGRTQKIAQARQVAMYLLINELEMTPTQVGRFLGGRDHATVIHGAGKINGEINEDTILRRDVLSIKESIFA
jgi:chromosomal replication initiator protein